MKDKTPDYELNCDFVPLNTESYILGKHALDNPMLATLEQVKMLLKFIWTS